MKAVLKWAEGAERLLATIGRACAWIAAGGIFAIVALLVASSAKRYLLAQPIHVTAELAGLLFLASTFLGLTYCFVLDRHVRLELLWRHLPYPWRSLFEVAGYALSALALILLVRQTWVLTVFSYERQGRSVMAELLLWPWRLLLPATLTLLLGAIVTRAAIIVLRVIIGTPARPDHTGRPTISG